MLVIEYLGHSHVNYARFFEMASFSMFLTVFKTYERRYKVFRSKEVNSEIIDTSN